MKVILLVVWLTGEPFGVQMYDTMDKCLRQGEVMHDLQAKFTYKCVEVLYE